MEKGSIILNLEQIMPFFNNGKNIVNDFIHMRKKHTYTYDFEDDEIKALISKLSEAMDNFLRYILLLYQFNNFNNVLDDYIYEETSIKFLEENGIIKSNVPGELDKFDEKNFTYLYKFLELVLPSEFDSINQIIENHVIVELSRKKFINEKMTNIMKFFIITNNFDKERMYSLLDKEEAQEYMGRAKEVLSEANDVFVKINDINKKLDSLDEEDIDNYYEMVIGLYIFCTFVNKNDYKFNIDVVDSNYWYNVKKYSSLIRKDKNDLNTIKESFKDNMYLPYVLKNYISVTDLLKYKELDIRKDTLKFFLVNNVPYETYDYLDKRDFNDVVKINAIKLNGNDYRKYTVKDEYFSLLGYLNVDSINKLTPRVLDYLLDVKEKFIKVFNGKYYEVYFEAFIKILRTNGITQYIDIIKKMDFEQAKIYDTINRYLGNKDEVTSDIIAENVMNNIEMFIDDEEGVIDKIPIMLNPDNNKIILTELLESGLDIDNIKYLDGTVFCYPSTFVIKVLRIMKAKEVDVFIDKKLNPNFIKYITQMIHKQTNYELPPIIIYRPTEVN